LSSEPGIECQFSDLTLTTAHRNRVGSISFVYKM
jgi:hypothetical protein